MLRSERAFQFPTIKLLDYGQQWQDLEDSFNPFAIVVMAHLKVQETKSKQSLRKIVKASKLVVLPTGLALDDLRPTIRLAHELVENGITEDKIALSLCRVGDRENEIREARSYIKKKTGYTLIQGSLPEKTAYRRASDEGKSVSEATYLSLKKRAEEIAQDVINLMSRETD